MLLHTQSRLCHHSSSSVGTSLRPAPSSARKPQQAA